MKKNRGIIIVAAFALVILGALAVVKWYQLKYITRLQEEVYAVQDTDVAKNLLRGRKPENSSSELLKVDVDAPVYQRGGSLYVGEEKEKVEAVFPFFANDGKAVMLVTDDQVLLDKQFEEVSTFSGMYVSDGLSFNYDKSQADDESYLFLKLSNGLFMNAQPIQFDYPGGQQKVRMNSIFCFEKEAVRYYGVQPEHSLWYRELPTVNMLMVTIGGETYSYEQFLGLLGLAGKDYKPKVADSGTTSASPGGDEAEQDVREQEEAFDIQEGEQELSEEEKTGTEKQDKTQADKVDKKEKEQRDTSGGDKKEKAEKKKQTGSAGASSGGNSNSAGSAEGGGAADGSTGGGAGAGNGATSPGSDGNKNDISGNDVSGNDVSGNNVSGNNPGFVRPEVSLNDFTADIYSIFSTLTIDDPAYTMKRVVIELYWQDVGGDGKPAPDSDDRDQYKLRYRKTFRKGGDIELDNLPPDTWIYAKATLYYMNKGETESFEFYDGFEKRVHTKPMDELDDIYLTFQSTKSDIKVPPHQMQIFDLTASGPNPNVLNKVSRVQINVTGTDAAHQDVTLSCQMGISDFRNKYCYTGAPEMEPEGSGDVSGNDPTGSGAGSGGNDSGADGSGTGASGDGTGAGGSGTGTGSDGSDAGEIKPRIDWTSVREAMDLPSNMRFDYEIKLLDSFGNAFTRIVDGYHGKARKTADGEAVDWESEKSLTCCEKKENYYTPTGSGYTSKTEPSIVMKQVKFEDNEKDIDRAKYELTMLDPDEAAKNYENSYYMELYMEDENGIISENAAPVKCFYKVSGGTDAPLETDHFVLPAAGAANGAVTQYEITGLTAGKIYELRIYGSYELNDMVNAEKDTPQLINSQRFFTADLSSLGSVMYSLGNKHVKTEIWPDGNPRPVEQEDGSIINEISPYESATAQELSLQINYGLNMTNKRLSGMISEIRMEVTDTTKEGEDAVIMRAVLDRDKMEQAVYAGTGDVDNEKRFELRLQDLLKDGTQVESALKNADGTPYVPKLYLETKDMPQGSTGTVWEAFADESTRAKLVLFWEDGRLTSNRTYRLNVQTFARQGGLNHDVTAAGAAYRSLNFTTLKKMPYVTWDSVLIVSDYIKIEGLDFHDEDGSISEGLVQQNLFGYTNGNPFSIESGSKTITYPAAGQSGVHGLLELLEYNGLVIGDEYRVDLAPVTIRRDSGGRYTLRRHNLFSYQFKAGAGLSGRLIFESIDYPLAEKDGKKYRRDEFRLYNAGGYSMDDSNMSGTGTVSDRHSNSSGRWAVSPFIPVKSGGLYYIDGIRGNSHGNWMAAAFYTEKKEDGKGGNTTESAWIDRDTWKVSDTGKGNVSRTFYISPSDNVIKIPAVSDSGQEICYMRFNMLGRNTTNNIPAYATADCFVLDDGEKKVDGAVEKIESAKFVRDTTNKTWIYSLKERQPVKPGEKYIVGNGVHYFYYYFYDSAGNEIKKGNSGQYMVSPVFTVPEGAASMMLITANHSGYRGGEKLELYKLNTEKLDWLRSRDIDTFANSLTVNVEDKLNNLVLEENREVFLKVWQVNADGTKDEVNLGGGKMEMQVTDDQLSTIPFNQLVTFDSKSNKKFEMELYVNYNGDRITLDTMEFETNRTLECIHDRTELAKLMRYPAGDFIVVKDFDLRASEGFYFGDDNEPFRGTLDFQGHRMTVNGGWTGISRVESGGVVKNLSLYSRRNGSSSNNYGLVNLNRGTLQNIVLELDLGEGMYRKDSVSGLCNDNYGTIENFSLYYTGTSSMYVGSHFGGVCRQNYGVIKNGYAYCPGTLSVTTAVYGGSTARSCAYSSLVVSRSWGDVSNVYVVGDLSVERYTDDGTLPYNALLTKYESGLVNNCITVGDFNRIIWTGTTTKTRLKQPYTVYGPIVSGNVSKTSTAIKNNYYYSNIAEPYVNNYLGVQEQVKDPALFQDLSFYDRTINSEGAFETGDIASGYFPRVKMPYDNLMMQQQKAPLIAAGSDVSTSYAFARVDEIHRENNLTTGEAEDYANVTLMFRNRLERQINDVAIDGLIVEPRDGYTAKEGEPKFEQYTEGGYYMVKVKLSVDKNRENANGEREVLYRKKYDVTDFTYNKTYTAEVKNRQIEVMFQRLVTQDNWVTGYDAKKKQWLTVFEDMQGCYRLGTDIDYTKFSSEEITGPTGATPKNRRKAAMEVFARRTGNLTTFYGSLDGQDVADKDSQYALKNFRLGKDGSSYVYLIYSAQGAEFKNFRVENLTIDQDGYSTIQSGLVAQSGSNSRFENIVMQGITQKNVYRYSGSLVGQSGFVTVQDCVLKGFRAESRSTSATDFRIGGFIGHAGRGGRLENCYAADVRIDALKGASASGVGALIGVGGDNPWIVNCYAQGKINSNFQYTGGLIGQGGILSGTWSKVNVTSSNRYAGGVSGNGSTIKNTLVLGEVFCTAPDNYNRVSSGSAKRASCFVSELQKLNSKAAGATDSGDAEGIMTVEEMKKEFWYWDKLNLGKAFDYTVVESGNLPRLKYKDGHDILPLQDLLVIEPESVPFTAEGLAKDNTAPGWASGVSASDDTQKKVHEYNLSVTLRFRYEAGKDPNYSEDAFKALFAGADGTAYGKLSIEDMDFVRDQDSNIQETKYEYDDKAHTYSLTFQVTPKRYLDSYRVVWDTGQDQENAILVFQKEEGSEKKDTPLYRYIYRVKDTDAVAAAYQNASDVYADPNSWQGAMRLAGDSMENFRVMEDLDFTGIKSASDTSGDDYVILRTGLKLNRLEGANQSFSMDEEIFTEWDRREYLMRDKLDNNDAALDFIEIRNLTFETNSAGVNWINELRADMKYLRFRNISWTGSGSNTGVVRSLLGNLSYIDIDGFQLRYKAAGDYIGFFVSMSGGSRTADYLRGRNIQVERADPAANAVGAGHYVGGIFGRHCGLVQHVGIKGTAPADGADKSVKNNWSYRVEGRLPGVEDKDNRSYTGGIGGYIDGSGLIFVYAENIYVEGNGYVGGIAGNNNTYNAGYNEVKFRGMQTTGKDPVYLEEVKGCYITGKNYVGGINGWNGGRWSLCKDNVIHALNTRAGGVSGYYHGEYNKAIDCEITADNGYAGGLGGRGNQHYWYSEVRGCVIRAPHHVGGMGGDSYAGEYYGGGVVHDSIIWGEQYVGGIWGYADDCSGVVHDGGTYIGNCYIGSQGEENMPKLVKKDDGTYEIQENVTGTDQQRADAAQGTYIGGVVGYNCGGRYRYVLVDDDVRVYGASYVGGIFGGGGGGGTVTDTGSMNIESGASVYVRDSYGGGFAGLLVGYEQSPKGPDLLSRPVTKVDKVILTGKVIGSAGATEIGAFTGAYRPQKEGLVNDGRPLDPEKGFVRNDLDTEYREFMSGSHIRRVTLALTEVSGKDPQLIGTAIGLDGTKKAVNQGQEHTLKKLKSDGTVEKEKTEYEGIDYLRVYDAMKIGGSTAKYKYPSWEWWNYNTGSDMAAADKVKLVTTADLKSIDFYYAPLKQGGMEMRGQGEGNVRYFNTDGSTYRFYYFYYRNDNTDPDGTPVTGIFPYITSGGNESRLYVYEWQPDGTTRKECQFGIPIPKDGLNVTFLEISEALDHVSTYASGAGSVNLEFPEILVTEDPAEEEGIMLLSEDDEGILLLSEEDEGGQSPGTSERKKKDASESGAALRAAAADILPAAEVMKKTSAGAMRKASGTSGRAAAKEAFAVMTMADTSPEAGTVGTADILPEAGTVGMTDTASDSSAQSAEEVITPVSYFQIYDGDGELLYEDRIGKQVYTIPYDFASTLTLKVFAGGETRSYMLTGETLKHTVMTWNDHCYYLKSDGIYRDRGVYTDDGGEGEKDYANTEKVKDGAFLHLYQGEALDEEGNIIDVESGESAEELDAETLYMPMEEAVPAYETAYSGEEILTYRTFSTTQDDEVVSDYRLFAHNDKLFGMDPELDQPYGQKFWNFVADYYSTSKGSAEYLSVLNENYVLEDYKTALNWPVEEKSGKNILRNYQIREVGDNLNADKSYVIIRYYDNTAAAFDYLTGSLLFVDDSEKKQLGFMEFANMWLAGKKASLNGANAYMGAKGLVEKLSENPVDDDLVAGYLANQALKGGIAEAGEERTDLAIDGSNDVQGNSMLTGSGYLSPDYGVKAPEKGSESETGESAEGIKGSEIVNTTEAGTAGKAQGSAAVDATMPGAAEGAGAADAASGEGFAGAGNEIAVDAAGSTAGGAGSENAAGDAAGNGIGKGDRDAPVNGAVGGTGEGAEEESGNGVNAEAGGKAGTGSSGNAEAGDGMAEKTGNDVNAEAGGKAGAENGMAKGGVVDAEAETSAQKETSESGEQAESKDSVLPDPTSDRAYVTMLTADSGGYEVFRATELLSKRGTAAMSENQKIKLLEANGLLQSAVDLESMKLTDEENRTGLLLVGTAASAMLLLLGLLYYKKRKM